MIHMVRRFFLSAFSSVVALAASALYSSAAAKAQNTTNTRMPSFPEPKPILVESATLERARRLLDAIARGTFDRSELAPQLNAFVRPKAFVNGATLVSALGAPESMFAFEKRITADQTSTYFRVRYPKEILTWVVSVDAGNRITGLSLQRGPNNIIFGVVWRDIRY
jgi:hypothetical protein